MSSSNEKGVTHNKNSINGFLFNDHYFLPKEILLNTYIVTSFEMLNQCSILQGG